MKLTRHDVLKKALKMTIRRLYCYSHNRAMTMAREGHEKEWSEAKEEVEILESLIEQEAARNDKL